MPSLQGYRPGPPLKAAPRPINEGSCCSRVSIMGSHPEGPSRSDGILMLSRLRVGSIIERDGYSREQLMRNRRRAEARGRALALTQGILAPVGWWRPAAWKQFKTQLPQWMDSQLEHWQEEALAVDAKERQVRRELEKMVGIEL